MNTQKISIQYVAVGIAAVFATWMIHEFVHWLTSELLGYDTIMRINGTSTVPGQHPTELHANIVSISAPVITVVQGLIIFLLLKSKKWNKYLYPFLFSAFYMRLLAGFMNLIMLNDEARVSEYLGIGTYTLSIFVSGILFYMVYKTAKKHELNWKFQLGTTIIVLVASSVLILSDQFFGIRIL